MWPVYTCLLSRDGLINTGCLCKEASVVRVLPYYETGDIDKHEINRRQDGRHRALSCYRGYVWSCDMCARTGVTLLTFAPISADIFVTCVFIECKRRQPAVVLLVLVLRNVIGLNDLMMMF